MSKFAEKNEKIFSRYLGQGLRYEIGAFVSRINGLQRYAAIVSKEDSSIKICVVPTNEELMIARETMKLL